MLVPFRTGRALKGFAREDFEFPRKVAKGRFLIPQRKGADKNETLHLRSSFVRKDFKLPLEGFGRMSFRLPNEGGGGEGNPTRTHLHDDHHERKRLKKNFALRATVPFFSNQKSLSSFVSPLRFWECEAWESRGRVKSGGVSVSQFCGEGRTFPH